MQFTNAPESNEAMNEEMSGHHYISNYISVPEFKEVLHELVQDGVENIVDKIVNFTLNIAVFLRGYWMCFAKYFIIWTCQQ